ncbi:uncharacterized protein LOC128228315 [Mya arenaria]|uniref:uncharacterized protein LOC128228315 n=1 Tax=Mya arenaria TaxID=6604 RepID=UPI0022E82B31|nr:uncharacterized protein LOC128228315 [Mya arenaria]XP_052795517.1 uncharacterized protein LOC128228315 [Mya arenaria]
MRRTGRLGIGGALGQTSALGFNESGESKPASVTRLDKEIQSLKSENKKLKTELNDIRSLYKQLVDEAPHEKFDERRVNLLKSQIIQLERQMLLLNEALSSRSEALYEVENNLQWLADTCRGYIVQEVRGSQVPVERAQLTLMVETAESARIKLYKQLENNTTQKLSRPLRFYSDFLLTTEDDDVTLFDVALGQLDHINLKHVTKLESKLSSLYCDLIHLHSIMEEETKNESACLWTSCHVTQASRERLATQILTSCARLKECSSDLMELSLLYPCAPWPPLKRNALKEITSERVIQCLPGNPRSRSPDTVNVIQALVKAYNYKVYMLNNQLQALKGEVKYHKKVYNLQLKYTESLFQAIREAYSGFEAMSNEVIVKPLKDVLEAFVDLSQSASEEALRCFMKTFRDKVPQLSDVIETLSVKEEESEGSKMLSQYGDEFFRVLEKIMHEQQCKRDREAEKVDHVRQEQDRLDTNLREILEQQEARLQQISMMSSEHENTDGVMSSDYGQSEQSDNKWTSEMNSSAKQRDLSVEIYLPGDSNKGQEQVKDKADSKLKKQGKPLHKKEWVNVLDHHLERDLSELSVNDQESDTGKLSDAELLAYHQNTIPDVNVNLPHPNRLEGRKLPSLDNEPTDSAASKSKIKKKLNYVPNTFVPNRTLKLRRSGSQTRLGSAENTMTNSDTSLDQTNTEHHVKSDRSRSKDETAIRKGTKPEAKFRSKPAFR